MDISHSGMRAEIAALREAHGDLVWEKAALGTVAKHLSYAADLALDRLDPSSLEHRILRDSIRDLDQFLKG